MATVNKNFKVKNGIEAGSTIIGAAATSSAASLRLPHGTNPASPTDGDLWTTTTGFYVRINGTNIGPIGGGGTAWGSITGTLSSQTDLQTALNAKAPTSSPTLTGTVTMSGNVLSVPNAYDIDLGGSSTGSGGSQTISIGGSSSASITLDKSIFIGTGTNAATMISPIYLGTPTHTGSYIYLNGTVTTDKTTIGILNTTATTITAFQAATSLSMGATTGTTTIRNGLTVDGTTSLPASTSIGTVSSTEIGYLDGVTSSIQTQLGNKSDTSHTHNYAGSASPGGSASSVANNLALSFDSGAVEGTSLYTFNGSAAKTLDIVAGSNITLTKSAGSVTIASTGGSSTPNDANAIIAGQVFG